MANRHQIVLPGDAAGLDPQREDLARRIGDDGNRRIHRRHRLPQNALGLGQPGMRPHRRSVAGVQHLGLVVERGQVQLVVGIGRGRAGRRGELPTPDETAIGRIERLDLGIAAGDVKPSTPEGEASAQRIGARVLRRDPDPPQEAAVGDVERRDLGLGVQHEDLAVGDDRGAGVEQMALRRLSGIDCPDLVQLGAEAEMPGVVRGVAADLRPVPVGHGRRQGDHHPGQRLVDLQLLLDRQHRHPLAGELRLVGTVEDAGDRVAAGQGHERAAEEGKTTKARTRHLVHFPL